MAQTSYAINIPQVAYPGQPYDGAHDTDKTSGLATAAAVPYGVLAVHDLSNSAGPDQIAVKVPGASTDITVLGSAKGVVLADQGRAQDPTFSVPTYRQYQALPLMRRGRVWVKVEEAVVDGDAAFVRFATGSGTQLGAFRKTADTATAVALPGAYYVGASISVGGQLYAVVQLSLV